jgi:hypothetical protein
MRPEFFIAGCFMLAWLAGFASWILGLVESRAIRKLTGRFFAIGPVVRRDTSNLPPPAVQPGMVIKLSSIQLKVAGSNLVIFAPLSGARFGSKVPFALKGQAKWVQEHVEITLRAPFFMFSFGIAWLSAAGIWVVAAIMFMPLTAAIGGVAAMVGGAILLVYFRRTAQKDAGIVLSEFTEFLGGGLADVSGAGPPNCS